jgi:ABC-type phosphate transport system substrate-binding protein
MTLTRVLLLLTLTTTGALGCASAAKQGEPSRSARNQLTREELARANSSNLYDAIAKVRPEWLSSRGPTSVTNSTPTSVDVFMNGSMLGNSDFLKQLGVLDVTEVRYWDAASASARFGMGHPRGVIELTRK